MKVGDNVILVTGCKCCGDTKVAILAINEDFAAVLCNDKSHKQFAKIVITSMKKLREIENE